MSLYPVSNFNIGTGVATEVLDSISSADGTLVVTFSNGVATFTNPITGTITNANLLNLLVDNTNGNYYITFSKSSSGYSQEYTAGILYNPSTDTLTATNFNGLATRASVANQVSPQVTPTTTIKYITFVEDAGIDTDLLVDKTLPLKYLPSTGTLISTNIDLTGLTNRLRLYERGLLTPTNYFDIYQTSTNFLTFAYNATTPMTLSALGRITLEGLEAGVRFDSQTPSSTDYYDVYTTGATSLGQYRINYVDGALGTSVNVLSINQDGLMWLGATNQTGVGLKLSDRTTANTWEMFSSANFLSFYYNTSTNIFRFDNLGRVDIRGTSASLILFDRTNTANSWATYSNANTLRWYYGGADRAYLDPTGIFGVDDDLNVGVANPATTIITMSATTNCRIATTLATMGTIDFFAGSTSISSGTVTGNTATFEIATSDITFFSNSTLFNGTPLICTRFGDCSLYHYTGAGVGTATYYVSCYWNSGTPIGGIKQVNATTVSFPTTSDRRLKEQIEDLTEDFVGNIFDTLKPRTYVWKESQEPAIGFIADELQSVLPDCVFGEPDKVNDKGEPEYQVADCASPSMIAILVAEVQFLRKRVSQLEKLIPF